MNTKLIPNLNFNGLSIDINMYHKYRTIDLKIRSSLKYSKFNARAYI